MCCLQAASPRAGSTRTGRSLRGLQAAVSGVAVRYGRERAEGPGTGAGPRCLWSTWPRGQVTDAASPAGWPDKLRAAAVPTPALHTAGHRAGKLLPSLQRYAQSGAAPWFLPLGPMPTHLPHLSPPSLPTSLPTHLPSHTSALELSPLLTLSSSNLSLPPTFPDNLTVQAPLFLLITLHS